MFNMACSPGNHGVLHGTCWISRRNNAFLARRILSVLCQEAARPLTNGQSALPQYARNFDNDTTKRLMVRKFTAAPVFYVAEDYHQGYFANNSSAVLPVRGGADSRQVQKEVRALRKEIVATVNDLVDGISGAPSAALRMHLYPLQRGEPRVTKL
jgi:hypothetical protein